MKKIKKCYKNAINAIYGFSSNKNITTINYF